MDQILQKLNDIDTRLSNLEAQYNDHTHTGLDSQSLPQVPSKLINAPFAAITPPTGGSTVDSQSRTAIGTIITTLQSAGITN